MEHVTTFETTVSAVTSRDARRLHGALDRFGPGPDIRSGTSRDPQAVFQWLAAAKGRYPIRTVRRHVCRHDEGIGDCTSAEAVTG